MTKLSFQSCKRSNEKILISIEIYILISSENLALELAASVC